MSIDVIDCLIGVRVLKYINEGILETPVPFMLCPIRNNENNKRRFLVMDMESIEDNGFVNYIFLQEEDDFTPLYEFRYNIKYDDLESVRDALMRFTTYYKKTL